MKRKQRLKDGLESNEKHRKKLHAANFVDIVSCNALEPAHTINNTFFRRPFKQTKNNNKPLCWAKRGQIATLQWIRHSFHKRRQTSIKERMRRAQLVYRTRKNTLHCVSHRSLFEKRKKHVNEKFLCIATLQSLSFSFDGFFSLPLQLIRSINSSRWWKKFCSVWMRSIPLNNYMFSIFFLITSLLDLSLVYALLIACSCSSDTPIYKTNASKCSRWEVLMNAEKQYFSPHPQHI